MTDDPGPMVRRRQLGTALRQFRLAADLTVTEAAIRLLVAPSKISRIENAQRNASVRDVRDLCDIYGVNDELLRKNLMELARGSRARAWWQETRISTAMHSLIGMEGSASCIKEFGLSCVPGLLQTRSYAAAITPAYLSDDFEVVESIVDSRIRRQEIFNQTTPPTLEAILDEAVLWRQVGGAAVMREQVESLIEWAGRPHVTLRVIPFSAGAHAGMNGNFTILEFPPVDGAEAGHEVPSGVYYESIDAAFYQDQVSEVRKYLAAYRELEARALSEPASRSLLGVRASNL